MWDEIILLEFELPEMDLKLFPISIRGYAEDLIRSLEVPASIVPMAILAVTSTALSTKIIISPKEGWNESVNTYSLITLPPANNKSAVVKAVTEPLLNYEKQYNEEHTVELKSKISRYKTQVKIIEKTQDKAAKTEDVTERIRLEQEIVNMEVGLEEPPTILSIFSNNTTPEALEQSLFEQGGKYAIISDEGGVFSTISGLYSKGQANVDSILKGIDGGDLRIRRSSRSYNINPFLTILIFAQPQILADIMKNPVFKGNGFLERFLYLVPKSKIGFRELQDHPICQKKKENYNRIIHDLLEMNPESPITFKLSVEASFEFAKFRYAIESRLKPGGDYYHFQSWIAKVAGYALRIAGQLHVLEQYNSNNRIDIEDHLRNNSVIKLQTILNALKICSILIKHAQHALVQADYDSNNTIAKDITIWIKNQQKTRFTKKEITVGLKNRYY